MQVRIDTRSAENQMRLVFIGIHAQILMVVHTHDISIKFYALGFC